MMKQHWFPVLLFCLCGAGVWHSCQQGRDARQEREVADKDGQQDQQPAGADTLWHGAGVDALPDDAQVRYGHDLIANTAAYLGPGGSVAHISNGMNCQNCHLQAGTVPFGNNYGKVYATYPLYRARNNGTQDIYDRVNDCLQRSLNGRALDSNTREMQAIYAYIKWLDKDVPKGAVRGGTSIMKLAYLDRAASPAAGKAVYASTCQRCHGNDGQGQPNPDHNGYAYPPLWGPHSFNDGAGLYRISSMAGFVYNNMPFGTDYRHPQLSEAEAWDVAAFVNSQPRPHYNQQNDWRVLAKKPLDFPFGPYADPYPEQQHKYGPFKPIQVFYASNKNKTP